MKFNQAVCFDDVVLVPEYSKVLSRKDVNTRAYLGTKIERLSARPIKLDIPVIGAPMDTVCGPEMCIALDSLGGLGILHRYNTMEDQIEMLLAVHKAGGKCGIAVSSTGNFESRAIAAANLGCRVICVDIAHGDHVLMEQAVGRLSTNNTLQDCYILAGNVATPQAAIRLAKAGANGIRTSVGSGAFCSTRIVTGFGLPTLQAVLDIAEIVNLRELPVDIIADGGIRYSGDAVKCLVAGAQAVMLGSVLTATDEVPGKFFYKDGIKVIRAQGMASENAMQSLDPNKKATAEGVSVLLSAKGPVANVLNDFVGGIRSGMSYAGVVRTCDMYQAAEFRLVSSAGNKESHPHILNK